MDRRAKVERSIVLKAPPAAVWAALTTPEDLSRWFGLEVVTLELRPGGRIVFRDPGGGLRRAIIETVDAPRRFIFRWLPALAPPAEEAREVWEEARTPGSIVELSLEEVPGGTELRVLETPWVPFDAPIRVTGPVYTAGPLADPLGAPPRILLSR